ncbi:riboflavin synthase subunit alpha [Psittacicella hinzii]|uniref:Riboflavin synthase subunit alpha n=1 Tax=Psittacicella hinzii TaxID=2028575 RepID=A0A3A1YHJ2_9GAMM|nr:riboflavin synthase subunit alpha [Psittacicella hinzii]RIY35694.1 riboflavin synthase subunit alpha [Psittacicella hinzii]
MFTGIVQQKGVITAIEEKLNARRHTVKLPLAFALGIQIGDSVANNGCCLSVISYSFIYQGKEYSQEELPTLAQEITQINQQDYALLSFDLISTTLNLTNLGSLQVGQEVNIERSFKYGTEVGGHIMSGHIDQKLEIIALKNQDNIYQLEFALPEQFTPYIFDKGFVGIDGMSLTVSSITDRGFTVNLIPDTLARTTIGSKQVGDFVNLEIDNTTKVIVQTVNQYLQKLKA